VNQKEKFYAEYCKRNDKNGYWEYLLPPENVWQFIEDNYVAKSEVEQQLANDKLGYYIFLDACGERVSKSIYDDHKGFKQVLPINSQQQLTQARKAAFDRAIEICGDLAGIFGAEIANEFVTQLQAERDK